MNKHKIAVIGLGYVGLPLAAEFAKKYPTVGFDINKQRIDELKAGVDATLELDNEDLKKVLSSYEDLDHSCGLYCTNELKAIQDCNIYIVTVPTPTDKNNRPVLTLYIKQAKPLDL